VGSRPKCIFRSRFPWGGLNTPARGGEIPAFSGNSGKKGDVHLNRGPVKFWWKLGFCIILVKFSEKPDFFSDGFVQRVLGNPPRVPPGSPRVPPGGAPPGGGKKGVFPPRGGKGMFWGGFPPGVIYRSVEVYKSLIKYQNSIKRCFYSVLGEKGIFLVKVSYKTCFIHD